MVVTDKNILIIDSMKADFQIGFRMLFSTYHQSMIRVASKIIDNRFAEDIVQDVFIGIWNNRTLFDDSLSLKAYLYGSVKNKSLSVLRKNGNASKYLKSITSEETFIDYIMDEDMYLFLLNTIEELPQNYRETLKMTLNGDTIAEIAEAINVSEDAVKAYKRRAKIILKRKMGELYTKFTPLLLMFGV